MDQTVHSRFKSVVVLGAGEIGKSGLKVFNYRQPFDIVHSHDFHEMVLVRKGSGRHLTEDGSYPIYRGDIFLVRPGHAHTYEEVKNLEIVNILYLPEVLNLPLYDLTDTSGYYAFFETRPRLRGRYRDRNRLTLNEEQLRQAEEIILEIEQEQRRKTPGNEYFRRVAFMRLIGLVCRAFSESESRPSGELTEISRIIRFFEQNYARPIRLEDLPPLCGKSVSSIVRLFREGLGQSPIEYLINLRLEKGAALLRRKTMTVAAIAAATGFSDSNYFTKMFSRKFALSPREYRKDYLSSGGDLSS